MSAELMSAVVAASNDGILVAEYHGEHNPIVFANSAFTHLTGYTCTEILGRDILFTTLADTASEDFQSLRDAVRHGAECSFKLRSPTKDGRFFWNQLRISYVATDGKITHVIAVAKDITQEEYIKNVLEKVNVLYREMSRRLEHINETDRLTQLKNRGHLSTRGEFILGAAKREKLRLHALLVDVDCFKMLNTLGGDTLGDECLVRIAEIIKRYFSRATDIAIRMCDDEFVIICIEDDDRRVWDRAELLRSDVRALKVQDFSARQHEVSVSIGIYSVTPAKHTTIEEMIQNAGKLVFQVGQGIRDQIKHDKANDHTFSLRH